MATETELLGYIEKLVVAAEEFRFATAEEKAARQVHDDAKVSVKLAGKVYYDARNVLDKLVGAGPRCNATTE